MNTIYQYIIGCAIICLLGACQNHTPEIDSDSTAIESKNITISKKQFSSSNFELGNIKDRSFSKVLNATGELHIPEKSKASISSLISGTLGAINLIEGQWVNKGQKLFIITNPELINLQEEYLIANGQQAYLNEEYNRQIDLNKENLSTKKELLKVKSELTTTRAKQMALQKKLNLYGINTDNLNTSNLVSSLAVTAPISGFVSKINVLQGMYIEPNQSVLTLSNNSNLFLQLSVLEKDAHLLRKDQKLTFTLHGNPNKTYRAFIYLISKSINENHMISVHCQILGDDHKILVPGMYANAKIVLENYTASALPKDAIVKINEQNYALSLQNADEVKMVFNKISIEVGPDQEGFVEIKKPNDQTIKYLTKGAYYLIQ